MLREVFVYFPQSQFIWMGLYEVFTFLYFIIELEPVEITLSKRYYACESN
ncbi:hypothetical protein J2751_003198 [Halorubrum alkaliphilum]|uniref:Uncharacterized protein n=1 Tax=Halorubrum alkaliphilum TaxID=261290 RepID=A0A8T4GME5_9EURY|nr:hypothetical protein [Halorubrum alkaliphilum]